MAPGAKCKNKLQVSKAAKSFFPFWNLSFSLSRCHVKSFKTQFFLSKVLPQAWRYSQGECRPFQTLQGPSLWLCMWRQKAAAVSEWRRGKKTFPGEARQLMSQRFHWTSLIKHKIKDAHLMNFKTDCEALYLTCTGFCVAVRAAHRGSWPWKYVILLYFYTM